jgi:hypothetical protein
MRNLSKWHRDRHFSENFSFPLYHFANTTYSFIYPAPVAYDLTNWQHHEITNFKEIKLVK